MDLDGFECLAGEERSREKDVTSWGGEVTQRIWDGNCDVFGDMNPCHYKDSATGQCCARWVARASRARASTAAI